MHTGPGGGVHVDPGTGGKFPSYLDPNGSLKLDGIANSTINDLRSAYALQRWLEKAARSGTRYMEVLRAFFNQTPRMLRYNGRTFSAAQRLRWQSPRYCKHQAQMLLRLREICPDTVSVFPEDGQPVTIA